MECFLSFSEDFVKRSNAKHFLLLTFENLREDLDNCGATGEVLTGLSKAFDFINHNLLIAKLTAYGVEKSSFDFIHSYLTK